MEIKSDFDNFEESQKVSQKFKYKVFYVMDKMLDFYHNSLFVELVFLTIQTFQLIGLLDQSWMHNSSLTSGILDFMQMCLFVPFFVNNSSYSSQFQIVFYFSSAFVLMIIMCFISTSVMVEQKTQLNQKQKSSHKIIFSFLDFLVSALTQVLYIPFFQLFSSTLRCEKNTNNQYSATQSQSVYFNTLTKNQCFAAVQIPNFILSIICMILLHWFSSFINKMYFDTRLDCTYKNSKISGIYELNLQYFVSNFCILTAFLFEERYQVIKVILSIAWWFNLLRLLNENMLYNHKLFSFLKLQQAMILFWTSLIGAYNYFFSGRTIVVFFWVVGIIFLTIYNINYEPINNDICAANSSNYLYVQEAINQLRILCHAIAKYDQYSLKIDGFLNRHRNDCNLPNCPSRSNATRIKKFNRMLVNQTINEDLIMSIFVIYTIFNNNILKFGGSNQIRLLYALFLLETIQNKDQCLIQLSFLLLNQPSLEEEFIAYRLNKVVMQIQNHKDYKKLDFSSEFTLDEYSSKFKKTLSSAVQNFLQFWQELLEPSPQAENLLNKGNKLVEQIGALQSQFDHLTQQRSLNQSAFRSYQAFSFHILEDKEHFETLLKQTIDQNEQLGGDEEGNLKEEDTYTQGTIVISSQEENFSSIVEVNLELLKIMGFLKSQVLSRNVSFLIPSIWQPYHNQFIDQYLVTGQKKIIGQQRDLFIRSRQDYSLPIKLSIRTIPSHTQGLLFQAQIVAQNLLYDYPSFIITNVNGQIETISPSVISMFNIDMKKVKQGMFIEKIIPSFWEYILDFQEKQGKDLMIKTYQLKMMKESKVKIHVQQIRFMNLGSQGYIISIKLSKSDIKSFPTISRKNQFEKTMIQKQPMQQTATPYKDKILISEYLNNSVAEPQKENRFLQSNNNQTCNQSSTVRSTFQKKFYQTEIFYDMRTNTFQGVQIVVSKQYHYDEPESDTNLKKQQKSIFSFASPKQKKQSYTLNNSNEKSFNKQSLYPFIYSLERSNEERVRDILDNSKNAKQKPHQVDNQVQNILENLIKMQQNQSNNKGKLSQKSQKKSKETDKNGENILPSVYIKSYEIEISQEEYFFQVDKQILNSEQANRKADLENEPSQQKILKDFSEGIKIFRLENNKLIDLKLVNENEDQNSENSNQNLENNQQIQQDENFEGEYQKELDEIILSKKNIKSFMRDSNFNHNSGFFTCKKIFSLLFLVFEIVYISVSLVLYQQQCNNTITRFQMYNVTHLFYANTQHIIEGVFNMFAIDKGVYYNYDNLDYSTSEFFFQKYLESETMYQFGLDEILTKLYLNKVGVTQQMEDLFINNRNIKILIHFIHLQTIVYPNNLYQASQQVLAKVYHFKRVPIGKFDYHNNDIYINIENFSNQLLNQIIQYKDFQEKEIFSYLNSIQTYTQDILFIGLLFILGYVILVFILYLKTLFCFFEAPSILTTIPLSQIRNQIKRYEQFLATTLSQEEEENQSNEIQDQKNQEQKNTLPDSNDHVKNNNNDIQDPKSPQNAEKVVNKNLKTQNTIKQQKYPSSTQNQENSNTDQVFSLRGITSQNVRPIKYSILNMKLIIPFFFSLIFFSVFIILETNLTQNFTNLLQDYFQELTYSVKLEPEFMLLFNCLKSQTQANNYIGVRQVYEPIEYFKQNINSMYDLMDNFTYTHYNNYNILPISYQKQFDYYFSKNLQICSYLYTKNPQYVNQTECNSIMNGQINEGMNININHLIVTMINYAQSIDKGNITLPYKHSVNQDMYQVQIIMNYLKFIMRELNDLLINEECVNEEDAYTQGIIVISSQEDNFANIVEVNHEMLKIIGFTKSQVLLKNISFLIPNIWQKHHNQFIDQFLATGQKKIIGQQRDLFIKSKQNYSLPIKLNIKTIPSHTHGLLFQASIVAQNLLYDYPAFIITQLNGFIDTISPSVISTFNIDMKKIKQGMFIEKIIPNFWEHFLDFQEKQGKELIIKTYQLKMMKEQRVKIQVQQIIFMNLASQGYIVNIKLVKNQITENNKRYTCFNNFLSANNNDKLVKKYEQKKQQNKSSNENQKKEQTMNTTNNQQKINSSSTIKEFQQMEIFYDKRTNHYLGTMIPLTKPNYYEATEVDTISQRQQKSFFSFVSPKSKYEQQQQQNCNLNQNDQNQHKQYLYPFVYTSERSNEERVKDILNNNTSNQKKSNKVGKEVQNILESLVKIQSDSNNCKGKQLLKSQKNSSAVNKQQKNVFPQVYIKSYEVMSCQEEYLNHIQEFIFNNQESKKNIKSMVQLNNFNLSKDYGENIKTLRLDKSKLVDIKQFNENDEQNSENSNQNLENNQPVQQYENTEIEYQKEIDEIVNSKKNIKSFMSDNNFNQNSSLFTYKKVISFLFLVFEVVYICLSLVIYQQQVNNIITRFQMYNVTHLYFANTQHIIEGAFNMFAIDKGSYYNYDSLDYQTAEFFFQKYLKSETIYQFALDEILTKMYLNKVGVTQQMQDLFINNRNIKLLIHFNNIQTTVYPNNLYQASQQVLAKVYHFKRVPLGKFDHNNNDVFINLENFSNQLLNQIIQYIDFQEEEIYTYLQSVQTYSNNILFVGLIFILAYFAILSILYLKTLFYFYEIPSILTSIPLSQIRHQVKRCEQFLNNTLAQDEEENQSNIAQEQQNLDQQNQIVNQQQKYFKRLDSSIQEPKGPQNTDLDNKITKYQFTNQQQKNPQNQEHSSIEAIFSLRGTTSQKIRPIKHSLLNIEQLIPFMFLLLLFLIYVIVDTKLTQNFTNLLQNFYNELKYSVKFEPNFMLLFNCLKSQTIANNFVGVRQIYEPIVYFRQNINDMYDLMDNLTSVHYNNYNTLPTTYQSQFDTYFSKSSDICSQLFKKYPLSINQTECNNFLNGKFNEGMNINIQHLITQMIAYSQSISKGDIQLPYKQSMNSQMYEIQMICNYLQFIMRELNDLFVTGIQSFANSLDIARIAISITICSLLFSIFLLVSIPIIQKIKSQIFSQRQIFCLIPKNFISENRHIRDYLLKQYLSSSKK
ncbi:hypothetical protein ABPG72_020543 [Tetrahymena utriculariae]